MGSIYDNSRSASHSSHQLCWLNDITLVQPWVCLPLSIHWEAAMAGHYLLVVQMNCSCSQFFSYACCCVCTLLCTIVFAFWNICIQPRFHTCPCIVHGLNRSTSGQSGAVSQKSRESQLRKQHLYLLPVNQSSAWYGNHGGQCWLEQHCFTVFCIQH